MSQSKQIEAPIHTPVMVQEVLRYLSPANGDKYLDLTAGYGGHASAVESAAKLGHMTLVDRDDEAVAALRKRMNGAEIVHGDFLSTCQKLVADGKTYDMVLADLGASSLHLDEAGRGFSFRQDGPLDMRMDRRQEETAADLVNQTSAGDLTHILAEYGQEPRAAKIAQAIVSNRPITSTEQLAAIIADAVPRLRARKRIHPATKSFQALRIAVNDEINQLEQSLPLWEQLLAPGGRLVVISFHSLEDRAVKRYLADHAGHRYDAELIPLTKKPVTASPDEIVSNPRARSAKLRAAAKIKTKRKDQHEELRTH